MSKSVEQDTVEAIPSTEPVVSDTGSDEGYSREQFDALSPELQDLVTEADDLEVQYRQLLVKKTANRQLLRAYRDMGKIPAAIVETYYPTQNRGPRAPRPTSGTPTVA